MNFFDDKLFGDLEGFMWRALIGEVFVLRGRVEQDMLFGGAFLYYSTCTREARTHTYTYTYL